MAIVTATPIAFPRHWSLAECVDSLIDRSAGPDACWLWRGRIDTNGYGCFSRKRTHFKAHRVVLELHLGAPLAPDIMACHHCDNRPCCNPSHLFAGTAADNAIDRNAKGRNSPRKGERNGRAVLTAEDVLRIRNDPRTGPEISAEMGVSISAVTRARSGRRWGHITEGQSRRPPRLTQRLVEAIRAVSCPTVVVARMFSVSRRTVRRVRSREAWRAYP